ncbi:hypothetical protein FACS189490_05610 [Clostridia bacterium]|nr:hypothetical protein FACS189490_05610 [Clostridia bacterium]
MKTYKTLNVAYLIIIIIGAVTGLLGLLFAPAPVDTADTPQEHIDTEYVTWVKTPAQESAQTPAQFVLPDMEDFVLPDGVNLAEGKKVTFSDYADVYPGRQAVDGRERTYWEGETSPSWITVDLGEPLSISQAVLRLPPQRNWGARTQVVAVSVSEDGESFTEVSARSPYVFNPQTGNGALIKFPAVTARFVRVDIESNTGAKGGQLSEFYVFN